VASPRPDPSKPHSRYRVRAPIVTLPVEHDLPVPGMPEGRVWSDPERALWEELWRSPQASQWDESYAAAVAVFVMLTVDLLAGQGTAWRAAEARQLADRLGLTPAGLLMNGWRLPEGAAAAVVPLRGLA
jgi:hypothetical protein